MRAPNNCATCLPCKKYIDHIWILSVCLFLSQGCYYDILTLFILGFQMSDPFDCEGEISEVNLSTILFEFLGPSGERSVGFVKIEDVKV